MSAPKQGRFGEISETMQVGWTGRGARDEQERTGWRGYNLMIGDLSGGPGVDSDEALIRAVYEQHGPAVLAYATRLMGDPAAAEDVLQETLLRAWRNSEVLVNGRGSVRAWLLRVAGRIVVDGVRVRAARPSEVAESGGTAVAQDHADQVIQSIAVFEALQKLSDEHRHVIVLLYFHGCSLLEASTALGVPAGTVKSRAYYALRALRKALGGRAGVLREVTA